MGKIRVKSFGDEGQEAKQEARKAARKAEKIAAKKTEAENKPAPVVSENKDELTETVSVETVETPTEKTDIPKTKKAKFVEKNKKSPSKRYRENEGMVAKKTMYPLKTAVELLKKFKTSKFDETIELHINVKEKGINGALSLPHGTGKKRVIKIADDETIAAIEKGVIDFDVLVAHPSMMPKLARVARVLGPRGLMPNPKNGTVTPNPEQMVEKLAGGLVNFKTESDAPIIHMSIGKISFSENQINENITSAIDAVKLQNVAKIILKSTMSPAVQIDVNSLGK